MDDLKFNVTPEMIAFIKEQRESYKLKASEFAERIGKSGAYVSKFDKGDYKTITLNDFTAMMTAITGDEESSENVVDAYFINYITKSNSVYYTEEAVATYDNVIRKLDIPPDLLVFIDNEITKNKFSLEDIINKINKNDELPEEYKKPKYEYNYYYLEESANLLINEKGDIQLNKLSENKSDSKDILVPIIKIKLEMSDIIDIFNRNVTQTNYLTLNAILYQLFRLKGRPKLGSEWFAAHLLSEYKFYNIYNSRENALLAKFKNEVLSDIHHRSSYFQMPIYQLISFLSLFFYEELEYVSEKVANMGLILNADPALLLAILGCPFQNIKDLDVTQKRQMFHDIKAVIAEYSKKEPKKDYLLI